MQLARNFRRTVTISLLTISFSSTAFAAYESAKLNKNIPTGTDTAFVGANIVNPGLGSPISDVTILVSKGRIVNIQPESQLIPENYSVVDIQDQWVMPGLIDGHIHLAQSGSAFTRPDTINAVEISSYEKDQQWLLDNTADILEKYLKLGVTTVFDMGGPSEYFGHYQKVTSNGVFPDIYAAGTLLAPMDIPQLNINGNTFTKVTSAEEAKALVRKQLILDSNMVKVVWSPETGLTTKQLYDLFQPAMALAHDSGRLVAVHVEDLANAKMAIRAGADILVHGVMSDEIDNEFIQLMKDNDVTYMPTLSSYSHYFEIFKNALEFTKHEQANGHAEITSSFAQLTDNISKTDQMFKIFMKYVPMVDRPAAEIAKLSAREQSIVSQLKSYFSTKLEKIQKENLKRVVNSGVNVAFGTDAGNPGTLHAASVIGELVEWQKAGVSNEDILKAMTYGNAVALQLDKQLGVLSAGKQADFIILNENPYRNIMTISLPKGTVKNGIVAKPDVVHVARSEGTHE